MDKAFVVMQVGAADSPERRRANEIYQYVISKALTDFELTPYRADFDSSPGPITPKMLSELLEARVVITDLTGKNPNVFYELGIAHSFLKPVVCVIDSVKHLPFDAKDERSIELGEYPPSGLSYAQGEKAVADLKAALSIVLADGYLPPSPLRDLAATRSVDAMAPDNPIAAELSQVREMLEQIMVVTSKPRVVLPRSVSENLRAMRSFIEQRSMNFDTDELENLKTATSSDEHDTWVDSLLSKSVPVPDPWATTPAPSGGYDDEPPF